MHWNFKSSISDNELENFFLQPYNLLWASNFQLLRLFVSTFALAISWIGVIYFLTVINQIYINVYGLDSYFFGLKCKYLRQATIVNVCVLVLCKIFARPFFEISGDFYALEFLRFAWSKDLFHSQFQAAEFNWSQFNIKRQMIRAPILMPFFHLKFLWR